MAPEGAQCSLNMSLYSLAWRSCHAVLNLQVDMNSLVIQQGALLFHHQMQQGNVVLVLCPGVNVVLWPGVNVVCYKGDDRDGDVVAIECGIRCRTSANRVWNEVKQV